MKAPSGPRTLLLVLAITLITSCSPLSKNVRQEAETDIPFDLLRQDPERHVGKRVVLGGHILEVRNLAQGTEITVLQTPLDFQDRPNPREQSRGRFVVHSDGFLDPAVYEEGRLITVAGTVQGRRSLQVDGHSYPTVSIGTVELHLWEKERPVRPFPYYDPFYDPFFYDPFYPWPRPYPDPLLRRRPWLRRR